MRVLDNQNIKAPQQAILDLPQERITGDILRGHGPRRGNLERLLKYWRPIMRKPGGFRRCLVILADHPELYPLERICAWLHHETTGKWPNEGNHHGRRRSSGVRKLKRTVRKGRKRRGKSYDSQPGVNAPIGRLERRIMRKGGSELFKPLDGSIAQIEFKADATRRIRIAHAIESVLLPGERGALKPTHLLRISLTPGGSGLPGPSRRFGVRKPGRGGATRGFRCPPGFERGGHFTDSRFSTCGHQLFGVPGIRRTAIGTVAAAARQKVGRNHMSTKGDEKPSSGIGGGMPVLPDHVGNPDPAKQASMTAKVLESMSKVRDVTSKPIRRMVREDGSILQPLAPLEVIAKQKNNPDLRNATFLTRINSPHPFGEEELQLMPTGLKSIEYSLPGGGAVSLKRVGGLMPPGKARAFGKAVAAAKRMPASDMDYGSLLRNVAAKTDAVTYEVTVPGINDPQKIVRVKGKGGEKRVPMWVYRVFLAADAPGNDDSVGTWEIVGPDQTKTNRLQMLRRIGDNTLRKQSYGPLQYTALPIPDYDAIDHTVGVNYKAAAFAAYRRDISWAFAEEKRASAVWDRGITRFRCPPGTSNAGQITNRFGIGCGGAILRRISEALRTVADRVDVAADNAGRAAHPTSGPNVVNEPNLPGEGVTGRIRSVVDSFGESHPDMANRIVDAIAGSDVDVPQFERVPDVPTERRGSMLDRISAALEGVADVVDVDEPGRGPRLPRQPVDEPRVPRGPSLPGDVPQAPSDVTDAVGRRPSVFDVRDSSIPTPSPTSNARLEFYDPGSLTLTQRQAVLDGVRRHRDMVNSFWNGRLGGQPTPEGIDNYVRSQLRNDNIRPGYRNTLIRYRNDWAHFQEAGDGDDALLEMPRNMGDARARSLLFDAGITSPRSRRRRADVEPLVTQAPDIPEGVAPDVGTPSVQPSPEPWTSSVAVPRYREQNAVDFLADARPSSERIRNARSISEFNAELSTAAGRVDHEAARLHNGIVDDPDDLIRAIDEMNHTYATAILHGRVAAGGGVPDGQVSDAVADSARMIAERGRATPEMTAAFNQHASAIGAAGLVLRERGIDPNIVDRDHPEVFNAFDNAVVVSSAGRAIERAERAQRAARQAPSANRAEVIQESTHFAPVAFGPDGQTEPLWYASADGFNVAVNKRGIAQMFGMNPNRYDQYQVVEGLNAEGLPDGDLSIAISDATNPDELVIRMKSESLGDSGHITLRFLPRSDPDGSYTGQMFVHAALANIPTRMQSKGIVEAVSQRLIFGASGTGSLAGADTYANIDTGTYAWARKGFDFMGSETPLWVRDNATPLVSFLRNPNDPTARRRAGEVVYSAIDASKGGRYSRSHPTPNEVDTVLDSLVRGVASDKTLIDQLEAIATQRYVPAPAVSNLGKSISEWGRAGAIGKDGNKVLWHPGRILLLANNGAGWQGLFPPMTTLEGRMAHKIEVA